MTQTQETPRLLRPREVAADLMLSESAVYRLVRRGELVAIRVGGPGSSLRIPESELERILRPIAEESS